MLAWVLGAVLALLSAAVLALFVVDWNVLRDEAEGLLSAAAGREVRIESLDVRPGWTTRVHLSGLTVANAAWGKADALAKVGEAEVAVRIWPLLRGQLEFREIVLIRPVIALEEGAEDRANWDLSAPAEAAGEVVEPEERSEFPAIGRLVLRDGRLSYRSPSRSLALDGTVATGEGDVAGADRIELSLDGTLEGRPLKLRFQGGSILQLRDEARPYPLNLDVTFGKTRVRADGTARAPLAMRDLD
ncbi:MAG: AsmA family protein, partial [Geminicoccales bacterium]